MSGVRCFVHERGSNAVDKHLGSNLFQILLSHRIAVLLNHSLVIEKYGRRGLDDAERVPERSRLIDHEGVGAIEFLQECAAFAVGAFADEYDVARRLVTECFDFRCRSYARRAKRRDEQQCVLRPRGLSD